MYKTSLAWPSIVASVAWRQGNDPVTRGGQRWTFCSTISTFRWGLQLLPIYTQFSSWSLSCPSWLFKAYPGVAQPENSPGLKPESKISGSVARDSTERVEQYPRPFLLIMKAEGCRQAFPTRPPLFPRCSRKHTLSRLSVLKINTSFQIHFQSKFP